MKKQVEVHCSFCGKEDTRVKLLIAGPDVFICNECVVLCTDMIFNNYAKAIDTEFEEMKARRVIFKEFWGTDI